jgi:hypothetical protein
VKNQQKINFFETTTLFIAKLSDFLMLTNWFFPKKRKFTPYQQNLVAKSPHDE